MAVSSIPKLSICVATFNRAQFLRQTLEHIVAQATDDCEIVVSDNASTDNTAAVVADVARQFAGLRYIRQEANVGFDRNFDSAVEHARGEYCWLFSDDDLPRPGAVARVLNALDQHVSLILVNIDFRTFDMSRVLRSSAMRVRSDTLYGGEELDRLFFDVDAARVYVGNIIIRRELWLSRNRERYYGSMFLHVAVIYQRQLPEKVLIIAEPLVSYRMANPKSYSAVLGEIWLSRWPAVVDSLSLSQETKKRIGNVEPWKDRGSLLRLRARGLYSLDAYRRWIHPRASHAYDRLTSILVAILPGTLVNTALVLYYLLRKDELWLLYMKLSSFYIGNLRAVREGSR